MINADLHCHSTASDGELTPLQLIEKAHAIGVELFSITDHDTLAAQSFAQTHASQLGLPYVTGVELTAEYAAQMFHIVGLNYDLDNSELNAFVDAQQQRRTERAALIAQKLEKLGVDNALAAAMKYAGGDVPGRPHFAQAIVAAGLAENTQKVFKRFLVPGKPGYVKQLWPAVAAAVEVIAGAGGRAVLAHPTRYKLSATKLRNATSHFADVGGDAIEVISGPLPANEVQHALSLAQRFDLAASQGSDFHGSHMPWAPLGVKTSLPEGVKPVWELFS